MYTLSAATLGRQVFTFEPFWTFDYIKTSVVKNNLKDRVSLYKVASRDILFFLSKTLSSVLSMARRLFSNK